MCLCSSRPESGQTFERSDGFLLLQKEQGFNTVCRRIKLPITLNLKEPSLKLYFNTIINNRDHLTEDKVSPTWKESLSLLGLSLMSSMGVLLIITSVISRLGTNTGLHEGKRRSAWLDFGTQALGLFTVMNVGSSFVLH